MCKLSRVCILYLTKKQFVLSKAHPGGSRQRKMAERFEWLSTRRLLISKKQPTFKKMKSMTRHSKIFLIIAFIAFTVKARADTWIDPTWKRMLDTSDVVALIQYTGEGDFRASAKILTIYKGSLIAGEEIWISGFSNRYGPIDKMSKGDKYLVFLNFNQPDERKNKFWNKELKTKPELKEFVEAYKNNKSYYVWSPTSGDLRIKGYKIQYDLIQTTFYRKQNFYSLSEFETFLIAYYDKSKAEDFCKSLISKIKPATNTDLNVQHLMKLSLLGYNKYDKVFENYIKVDNPSSKYALAQLMGNINTVESRNILIALLDDKHSIVQGEAVRQLKNEPAEIIAPILLKHLKTSANENFGPANIMDPVMNTIDGGKIEIIKTLGELKYKPAIPDLLLLLDNDNVNLFTLVIETLKKMGSKDYITYINKHLDNKTHDLIFDISMMIAEDSLVECLPSFKIFISTCNRNRHPNYEYSISTCCGIGNFTDSGTVAFLLSDYKRFLSYKDTLESRKEKNWTQEYIKTFTDLETKEARPLIYKSIYDWFGLNEDFGKYPKLFQIKKQLEDSINTVFATNLGKREYELDYCIAFIENTGEVINGKKPLVKYMIQVTLPTTDKGKEHREIIAKELNIPLENVYVRFSNGIYWHAIQDRFDDDISFTPLSNFIHYAKAIPNHSDLLFLQGLLDNNLVNDNYNQKKIREAIEEIKASLNN